MSKKIVIEPCFNEAHFLERHIRNVCDYLKPDIFVIAEGMFPKGPENTLSGNESFVRKFTLDGKRSFDFQEIKTSIKKCQQDYPRVEFHLLEMDYGNMDTALAYHTAYTSFLNVTSVASDDIVFPLECDLFFTEEQGRKVVDLCNTLTQDTGFCSTFQMFFESPKVNIAKKRARKIAFRYGTGRMYDEVMLRNFNDTYQNVFIPTFDFGIFHYEWVRPGKYFKLRLVQLPKIHGLSEVFKRAQEIIRSKPTNLQAALDKEITKRYPLVVNNLKLEDHPRHIHDHPNLEYYYE